jgi:hypothetical protein
MRHRRALSVMVILSCRRVRPARSLGLAIAIAMACACALVGCAGAADDSGPSRGDGVADPFGNAAGPTGGASSSGGAGSDAPVIPGGASAGAPGPPLLSPDAGPAAACATAASRAELERVHLLFAFDVSGSMGKGDEPWHDKALKWDPVVAATRSFFEDDASAGLVASLTFFPEDGDDDDRCVQEAYEEPDVAMTELPSSAFGEAIDDIEPASDDDWRGGTPTAFVMRGTLAFAERYREQHAGRYAMVLVTDGYPQGCDDEDDSIEAVAAVIDEARDADLDSYVIGVANPPVDDAPDTVSDLHALAEAGGTGEAFLIDTGDPAATAAPFAEAIAAIRATAISCSLAIPEAPMGRSFDKERIAVRFTGDSGEPRELRYDATCATPDTWHYDEPATPAEIVLCPSTCDLAQSEASAAFEVELACEQLFMVD